MFTNPLYYLLILICFVAIGWYYYRLKKKGAFKHEEESKYGVGKGEGVILCRVADNIEARIYNTYITQKQADEIIQEHETLGRQWFRDGKRMYGLNKYKDNEGIIKLRPIKVPSEITNAPSELFNDMQQPEIEIFMNDLMKDDDKGFGEKYGWLFPWIVALAFLAFLWSQS